MEQSGPPVYNSGEENEPLSLTPDQKWVCGYLDKWFPSGAFLPSDLFKGAIAALSAYNKKNNPDWLSQSANSIRDIIYNFTGYKQPPVVGDKEESNKKKLKETIIITQQESEAEEIAVKLNKLYKIFTVIAHHSVSKSEFKDHKKILKNDFGIEIAKREDLPLIYNDLLDRLVFLLKRTAENMLEIHKKIDSLVKKGIAELSVREIEILLHAHINARHYFYTNAPVEWVEWLNKNGFFAVLNKEAENKTQYSFRLPELAYLERVAESKEAEKVVDIINLTDCANNFNPEVVDRFLTICRVLPAGLLSKILPKIESEQWVFLMKGFDGSAYRYDAIVENVIKGGSDEDLLILAKAMLIIAEEEVREHSLDRYFYLKDISKTGLLEGLNKLQEQSAVKGIELLSKILADLTHPKILPEEDAFTHSDVYYLYDLDFYDLESHGNDHNGFKEDIRGVLKLFVSLIQVVFKTCDSSSSNIYDLYIRGLPDSETMWRVKLFAMSLCPKIFNEEIKKELERIFSTSEYGQLLSVTDYLNALKVAFPMWPEPSKREYVKKILEKFNKLLAEVPEDSVEKRYHTKRGWELLSGIALFLTVPERESAGELFKKQLDETYEPEARGPLVRGGSVKDRSPVDFEEEKYSDVSVVINELKGELAPEIINEKYKHDDFLNPRNAEGVGEALKKKVKDHMSEYLVHATEFFDSSMHIHYTYSFLRSIEDYLRSGSRLNDADWENLLLLFEKITQGEKRDAKVDEGRWLARWIWVEKVVANILLFLASKPYEDFFKKKRAEVLVLIKVLLQSEDPSSEDEAKDQGNLHSMAINSTRGVAMEALVNFASMDGRKLGEDTLNLYMETIADSSLSVRFIIGKYLATFYFGDKEAVPKLFESIFPRNAPDFEQFFAAWEGYLTSGLYQELFEQLEDYYEFALSQKASVYPSRRESFNMDEGIGTHLALAFAHFKEVTYTQAAKHRLLEILFEEGDVEKQKEFISFIGRGVISNGSAGVEWFEKNHVDLEKLKDLWTFLLGKNLSVEVYAEFGHWINHTQKVFDYDWLAEIVAKTLEKSGGRVSWSYGIEARLLEFAKSNPKATLVIVEKLFLEEVIGSQRLGWFHLDEEKIEVFKTLYIAEPEKTKGLVNELLIKGGRPFWPLKDIIDDSNHT